MRSERQHAARSGTRARLKLLEKEQQKRIGRRVSSSFQLHGNGPADIAGFVRMLLRSGRRGDSCSIGALYTTIDRLESKGFLVTWMGEATAQRGGRAKRMVRVTADGVRAAKDFYKAVIRISRNASWTSSRIGGSAS